MSRYFFQVGQIVAMLAALWFGFVEDIAGARNVAYFLAWLSVVASLVVFSDRVADQLARRPNSLSRWILVPYQLTTIAAFTWVGSFATAGAFALASAVVHATLRSAAERAGKAS